MPRRTIAFIVFSLAVALVCVRLGVWQLDRREEVRRRNAEVGAQLRERPAPFTVAVREGDGARHRRVTLAGTADYAKERVHAARTRDGSPGVHILTPIRLERGDTAVLVNRGWIYAPDGATADLSRWREGESLMITGYVERFEPAGSGGTLTTTGGQHVLRRLDHASASAGLPYPLARLHVVATEVRSLTPDSGETPPRLPLPSQSAGPHLGYAIQWFAFAAIAVIGAGAVAMRARG